MGNNYQVYFSIKLTGNQFGQKKNQGLVFNHLKEKKHLKKKCVAISYKLGTPRSLSHIKKNAGLRKPYKNILQNK